MDQTFQILCDWNKRKMEHREALYQIWKIWWKNGLKEVWNQPKHKELNK